MTKHVDVLIAGAGISGIAAAYHLQKDCPDKTFAIIEARDAIGGTWDLFRYPGIRSDSDMYTFGFSFYPWKQPQAMAPAPAILEYLNGAVDEFGIRGRIRFGARVERLSFSTAKSRWSVDVRDASTGEVEEYSCNFFWGCTGYYRYDAGYTPEFEGLERFGGPVVHPQQWTDDINYDNKRVVVIGSGATAVTLVPALTEKAQHVTMLQRSPSYVASVPQADPVDRFLKWLLGEKRSYRLLRWKYIFLTTMFYRMARRFPGFARGLYMGGARKALQPGYDVETHFNPSYPPWDQRLCMVPDGDLFEAIKAGKAAVVTDEIQSFTERGIAVNSGAELDADLIVTATGITLQLFGGAEVEVDGEVIDPSKTVGYKGAMLSGVPNFAFTVGYVNASWTLRAEITSQYVCNVLNKMDEKGCSECRPRLEPGIELDTPVDLSSGYFQRSAHILPQRGKQLPWRAEQNYKVDRKTTLEGPIDDGILEFAAAGSPDQNESPLLQEALPAS
ncbi:MAG: NAD(P)/FAD-dependent oxidoreductase [Myxococcota bacterium]